MSSRIISPDRSHKDRIAFVQSLRRKLKPTGQAKWDGQSRKRDPMELILAVNRQPHSELAPIKVARMVISPFAHSSAQPSPDGPRYGALACDSDSGTDLPRCPRAQSGGVCRAGRAGPSSIRPQRLRRNHPRILGMGP